ncbi:MAG TPA: monooxygenase, partial [Alphaproteobacteria bacterium]|nr:monooxygenase [Alphaproteobacteria bacterium]
VSGGFAEEDLVNDGWTEIVRNILLLMRIEKNKNLTPEELAAKAELADFQKMEQVRARAEAIVKDPNVAESLKPYYRQFCKRPCFHDDYLETFNRPNVTLVDTQGKGVERVTETSVIANGQEYPVDCLVFATGFEVGTDYVRRSGYELYGRDGVTLTDKWKDGAETFQGFHSRGFPNCFFMGTLQSAFTANFPHALNEQAIHIAHLMKKAQDGNIRRMEATQEAEDAWVDLICKLARMGERFYAECTPGYYNNEGQNELRNPKNTSYGGKSERFFKILEDWREEGDMKGLEIS